MENRSRQWGLDLARVIATYGIVLIHSGDYAPYSDLAQKAQEFFRFSLPFFLAASFYLLVNPEKKVTLSKAISTRFSRLLLPYVVWTLVYLSARIIKESMASKSLAFGNLFQDPVAVIFYGSAAVHLYFLPLLFTGNLFAIAIDRFKTNLKTSILLFLASLAIYNLALQYSVNFSMAFVRLHVVFYSLQISNLQPLLKFLVMQGWFIIICLPYIFFARSIHAWMARYPQRSPISNRNYVLLLLAFVMVITVGRSIFPFVLNEPIYGCLLLVLAINFPSTWVSEFWQKLLLDLSQASFGIYLLHHLIVNFSETLTFKKFPEFGAQITIVSQLVFSISGFLISWAIVRIFTSRKINFFKV
ncbi:acyltransferase family protein [Chamaesiphon polymorphus]|uniref:Acyltransferase 3 domain-containing protein n=1 Tax=Chamaesiphon polymorphus CCALA 037 TaxID=2107692 RepID=A0A2T1GMD6_9CYAN|nr:acyltransferase [Chamaesiphon polymorphus]PSB59026.1 hypothetical protein C7B77_02410 [Chamaesiphon polymorphus CCALA 037]